MIIKSGKKLIFKHSEALAYSDCFATTAVIWGLLICLKGKKNILLAHQRIKQNNSCLYVESMVKMTLK